MWNVIRVIVSLSLALGCQAFSDYQMQQMTSNFIDQFGFNDEKFADQDDIGK